MDIRFEQAKKDVEYFIRDHPKLSVSTEESVLKGHTNRIVFGSYEGKPIVFKCFCRSERKTHEKTVLKLFEPTGLVPKLYPVETETILVMERLPNMTLLEAEYRLRNEQVEQLYYQLGQALARIVEVAPGSADYGQSNMTGSPGFDYEFYRHADLRTFFCDTIERAMKALSDHAIPDSNALRKSLCILQRDKDIILSLPSFIHQDDLHHNNIMVDDSKLQGFIDLEMSRYGNEILLLGAALCMCRTRLGLWSWLKKGYQNARGRPIDRYILSLARCAAPFTVWIRFAWYWGTDDLPQHAIEENLRQSTVNKLKALIETMDEFVA